MARAPEPSLEELRETLAAPGSPRAARNRARLAIAERSAKAGARADKLRAVAADPAAAVGERRNARVALADLLADWPELDCPAADRPPRERPFARASETAEARRARTRQSVPQGPELPTQDELREIVAGEVGAFLERFGSTVERRLPPGFLDWFDDDRR